MENTGRNGGRGYIPAIFTFFVKISFSTNSTKKKEMEFCIIIFLIEFRRGGGLSGQVNINGRPGGGRRRRTGNRREEREERKTEVERATPVHTALSDFSGVETEAKEGSWVTLWEQQSDLKLLHVTRDTLPR